MLFIFPDISNMHEMPEVLSVSCLATIIQPYLIYYIDIIK
jgi:hypothetical protein